MLTTNKNKVYIFLIIVFNFHFSFSNELSINTNIVPVSGSILPNNNINNSNGNSQPNPACSSIYLKNIPNYFLQDLYNRSFWENGTVNVDYLGRLPKKESYDNLNTHQTIKKFLADWKKQTSLGRVTSKYDKDLDTWLYYTFSSEIKSNGEAPLVSSDSEAVVIFFHGSGTAKSSGINAQQLFNSLIEYKISGISFDYPFHGKGPHNDKFYDKMYFLKWLNTIVTKAAAFGKPVYLIGHSYGPDVIAEYLTYYPFSVQGAMFMSPAGFDPILSSWYQTNTKKMNFGGDVQPNEMGGRWAAQMSQQFIWNRTQGQFDPSVINPNLNLNLIYGNWEEYAPAPVGGKNKTPIGKNTYNIGKAFTRHIKNVNQIELDGIGHYLFDYQDSKGRNAVQYNIVTQLLGLAWKDKKDSRPLSSMELVRYEYIRNTYFKYFVDLKFNSKGVDFISQLDNDKIAKKILLDYEQFFYDNIESHLLQVLKSEKDNQTDFYEQNKDSIEFSLKKNKLLEEMYMPSFNRLKPN